MGRRDRSAPGPLDLGGRKWRPLALGEKAAVEFAQDHGSSGMPVDDRGDLARNVTGPVAGDPLEQERLVFHTSAQAIGQVAAEQMAHSVAAVIYEVVGEELRLDR